MTIYEIANMISMRHCGVTTSGPMNVISSMSATVVALGAATRVIPGHGYCVLIDVVPVRMMKVSIMQVVCVTIMLDGHVTTAWSMNVIVVRVDFAVAHTKIGCAIPGLSPRYAAHQCCVQQPVRQA